MVWLVRFVVVPINQIEATASNLHRNRHVIIHAGLAGPTPVQQLIKFALRCGVGVSKGALLKGLSVLGGAAGFVPAADEVLLGLVGHGALAGDGLIRQPHIYGFGGIEATVHWIQALRAGFFEVDVRRNRIMTGK